MARRKFWIINSHLAVRKIISGCGFCRHYKRRATEHKVADLPKERILPDLLLFTNTGVDYFGPMQVKRGRVTCKRWSSIHLYGKQLSILRIYGYGYPS